MVNGFGHLPAAWRIRGRGTIRYGPGLAEVPGAKPEYGLDVLARAAARRRPPVPQLEADPGLVVEDAEGGFCGAVVSCEKGAVTLEDRHGNRRGSRSGPQPSCSRANP